MVSLTAPLWLLGLLGLPAVRWLHRFSAGNRAVVVSALFLWPPGFRGDSAARKSRRPDPRWRLRALLVATILMALAGPELKTSTARTVDVWVDDSLSMQTVEHGETRLQTAFGDLDRALSETGIAEIQLHSLRNPAVQVAWRRDEDTNSRESWPKLMGLPPGRLYPPIVALMNRDHEHWLISDGADVDVNAWAEKAPLRRILQTGTISDNVALTLLSVRPTMDGDTSRGLTTVRNLGGNLETRTLSVYSGDKLQFQKSLRLPPHGRSNVHFELSLPDAKHHLRAILTPADALAEDDALSLEKYASSPASVSVAADCPTPLKIALGTHPGILIAAARQAHTDMRVVCDDTSGIDGGEPTLRIHAQRVPRPLRFPPVWAKDEQQIDWPLLQPQWLYSDSTPRRPGTNKPLFGTAENPLITVSIEKPRAIDVFFDIAQPVLIRQPEYAVLIDGLLSVALGRRLFDETFSAQRPVAESYIAPHPMPEAGNDTRTSSSLRTRVDLTPLMVLMAALLLVVDIRRTRYTRRGVPAQAGA